MKCPLCQSEYFIIKDPEDEYNYFKFKCADAEVEFDSEVDVSEVPEVRNESETYCINCAWHGQLQCTKEIKSLKYAPTVRVLNRTTGQYLPIS